MTSFFYIETHVAGMRKLKEAETKFISSRIRKSKGSGHFRYDWTHRLNNIIWSEILSLDLFFTISSPLRAIPRSSRIFTDGDKLAAFFQGYQERVLSPRIPG